MTTERKGVIVKFPLDELAAIDTACARAGLDRSAWIRARLAEAVEAARPSTQPSVHEQRQSATIRRW